MCFTFFTAGRRGAGVSDERSAYKPHADIVLIYQPHLGLGVERRNTKDSFS